MMKIVHKGQNNQIQEVDIHRNYSKNLKMINNKLELISDQFALQRSYTISSHQSGLFETISPSDT